MRLPIHQIDAFADRVLEGNPAAVVPLPEFLPDPLLAAVARENNLSETAYIVGAEGDYALRWFTPAVEVELCGHATLAAAWVVTRRLEPGRQRVRFRTRHAGDLVVEVAGDLLRMDFPSRPARPVPPDPAVAEALGVEPLELHGSAALYAVLADEAAVRAVRPDQRRVAALPWHGVAVTAPGAGGDAGDFVSRYFVPASGIDEDPVTGSTHCTLAPFWSARLGRAALVGRQVSARSGRIACEVRGDRVFLAGRAVPYLEGFIEI